MNTLKANGADRGRTSTGRAVGSCGQCGSGIATDGVTAETVGACPACGARVRLALVYGEHSEQPCNGACMGAVGPNCSCGCDGANHGRWFLRVELVPVFEREQARAAQTKRRAAHTARREAAAERARAERAADDVRFAAMLAEHPELSAIMGDGYADGSGFVIDMRAALAERRELTPGQITACVNMVRRDRERAARRTERDRADADAVARGVRVPAGRVTFTGEIVLADLRDANAPTYHGRTAYKILVASPDGWRVWGTAPASIVAAVRHAPGPTTAALRGRTVTLTATVKPSDRDPLFGYFNRPAGELVDAPAPVEPVAAGPLCDRCGFHHTEPCTLTPAPVVAQVEPVAPAAPFVSGWGTLAAH